jgi:heme exporter protein D
MELAHNEGYVIASYVLTLIAMIVIIGWVLLDSKGRQKELKKLEEAGIRRRSAAASSAAGQTFPGKTPDA